MERDYYKMVTNKHTGLPSGHRFMVGKMLNEEGKKLKAGMTALVKAPAVFPLIIVGFASFGAYIGYHFVQKYKNA